MVKLPISTSQLLFPHIFHVTHIAQSTYKNKVWEPSRIDSRQLISKHYTTFQGTHQLLKYIVWDLYRYCYGSYEINTDEWRAEQRAETIENNKARSGTDSGLEQAPPQSSQVTNKDRVIVSHLITV